MHVLVSEVPPAIRDRLAQARSVPAIGSKGRSKRLRAYKEILKEFILRYRLSRLRGFFLAGLDDEFSRKDIEIVSFAFATFNGKPFIRSVYERRLSPSDIALWLGVPVHVVMKKVARWPVLHEDPLAPALNNEMLRTLIWKGGGRWEPPAMKTATSDPIVVRRRPCPSPFVMYEESFTDHLVEGEFSGFTPAWTQAAVDLLGRLGIGPATARNYLGLALKRWRRDRSGYMYTSECNAKFAKLRARHQAERFRTAEASPV